MARRYNVNQVTRDRLPFHLSNFVLRVVPARPGRFYPEYGLPRGLKFARYRTDADACINARKHHLFLFFIKRRRTAKSFPGRFCPGDASMGALKEQITLELCDG